ncbi:MAG: DUF2141 domain-containing protein [Puniceicoccaceae bacterium]
MKIVRLICLSLLGVSGGLVAAEEKSCTLTVNVLRAVPGTGQILVSVFSSVENYLKQPIEDAVLPVDHTGSATIVLTLPKGTYSVSVVYDKNSNGKLDTGFMRIPKERIAFSNNARSRFGPPKFKDSSFNLSSDKEINLFLVEAKE